MSLYHKEEFHSVVKKKSGIIHLVPNLEFDM